MTFRTHAVVAHPQPPSTRPLEATKYLCGSPVCAFEILSAETDAVGRAAVPDLPDDVPRVNWDFVMRFPAHMHASMLDDLNRGKPLEHEYLSGDVVRLGQRYGVPTPIHSVLYAALKPIADALEPMG